MLWLERLKTNPADPYVSVRDTIAMMKRYAWRDAIELRPLAAQILRQSADLSVESALEALYYWVKTNITFQPDELLLDRPDKELLITPKLLIQIRRGDCDDFSTLLASLILAAGLPVSIYFVTVAADPQEPERFSHVYVMVALPDGRPMALDASHGLYPGWEIQRNVERKLYWPVKQAFRYEVANWYRS